MSSDVYSSVIALQELENALQEKRNKMTDNGYRRVKETALQATKRVLHNSRDSLPEVVLSGRLCGYRLFEADGSFWLTEIEMQFHQNYGMTFKKGKGGNTKKRSADLPSASAKFPKTEEGEGVGGDVESKERALALRTEEQLVKDGTGVKKEVIIKQEPGLEEDLPAGSGAAAAALPAVLKGEAMVALKKEGGAGAESERRASEGVCAVMKGKLPRSFLVG